MANESEEIIVIEGEELRAVPSRSMREGLLGKSLEDGLQTLLQRFPQVIPGSQIDPEADDPPRFALLRREVPVGSWSLDHLFVDQYGVLTLVETKLIQNPQSRREVIGQIIEYAANAADSWTSEELRQFASEFWAKDGQKLDKVLADALGEIDVDDLWNAVDTNLRDGRIRLIIAADEISLEVRRMIEYLNREMQKAEVLGLEFKVYGDKSDSLIIVPRVVGHKADRPGRTGTILWTVDRLRESLEGLPDRTGNAALRVLDWTLKNDCHLQSRAKSPTFGISGKLKDRIATVQSGDQLYVFLEERKYPGGAEERDVLLSELKALGMYPPDLDPNEVVSGRTSVRRLWELEDGELDNLIDVLAKYFV